MNTDLEGISCFYYQWNILKEILTIFFVVVFIDYPYVQLLPVQLMTVLSIVFLIVKKPFKTLLRNVFSIVVEFLYLTLFVGMLVLKLLPEKISLETRHKYFGATMIVIICLILGAFISLGVFQLIYEIVMLCKKKAPGENSNNTAKTTFEPGTQKSIHRLNQDDSSNAFL